MLSPVRVTPPAVLPVSLEEAKAQLRVEGTDEDGLIEGLIEAAVAHLDGWSGILGRCLINQQWRVDFCAWPSNRILRLPFPDVSAVAVVYMDADGIERTVSAGSYYRLRDARGAYLQLKNAFTWPSVETDRPDAVQVTLTAGYGAAAGDVPADIRHAIKLLVGAWYENREETVIGTIAARIPDSVNVDALVSKHRVGLV